MGELERGKQKPSVIGFVHAPRCAAVDGVMITITCAEPERGSARRLVSGMRPWGFISDPRSGHGFTSCEEAMRAAELAFRTLSPGETQAEDDSEPRSFKR